MDSMPKRGLYAVIGSTLLFRPNNTTVQTKAILYDQQTFKQSIPTASNVLLENSFKLLPDNLQFKIVGSFYKAAVKLPRESQQDLPGAIRRALTADAWSMSLDLNQIFHLIKVYDQLAEVTEALGVSVVVDLIFQYAITTGSNLQPLYSNPRESQLYLL